MRLCIARRKACGLMGAVAILSIIYYGLMILHPRQVSAGQCRGGNCSAPAEYSPQSASTGYAWIGSGPWRLEKDGQDVGTLFLNGTFLDTKGNQVPCPSTWYTQEQTSSGVNKVLTPTGDTDPKLFGIATKEQEQSQKLSPTGYTIIDKDGNVKNVTSGDAFNAVGDPRLRSLYTGYNVAIIGVDAAARQRMAAVAKAGQMPGSPIIVNEYDANKPDDLWHVQAQWNEAVAYRPGLQQSGAVAYFTNGPIEKERKREVVAWTPDELSIVVKDSRPNDRLKGFDMEKAKVDQGIFGNVSWPLTTAQTAGVCLFVLLAAMLLFTPAPPVVEE
jgi:hypothetical protein